MIMTNISARPDGFDIDNAPDLPEMVHSRPSQHPEREVNISADFKPFCRFDTYEDVGRLMLPLPTTPSWRQ